MKLAGIETGKGIKLSILQVHQALTKDEHGVKKEQERAKLRTMEAQAELAEIELQFGMLPLDQAKRLKELEKENARLKRLLADEILGKELLKEALEKKL
jgi:hypothetical protein